MSALEPRSVYVIGPDDGPFKIGITRNVRERLEILQAASDAPVRLHLRVEAEHTRVVKRHAHDMLERFAAGRDWFRCSLEQAIAAVYAGLDAEAMAER